MEAEEDRKEDDRSELQSERDWKVMKSQIICSHIVCQLRVIIVSWISVRENLEKLHKASLQRAPDISVINLERSVMQ